MVNRSQLLKEEFPDLIKEVKQELEEAHKKKSLLPAEKISTKKVAPNAKKGNGVTLKKTAALKVNFTLPFLYIFLFTLMLYYNRDKCCVLNKECSFFPVLCSLHHHLCSFFIQRGSKVNQIVVREVYEDEEDEEGGEEEGEEVEEESEPLMKKGKKVVEKVKNFLKLFVLFLPYNVLLLPD